MTMDDFALTYDEKGKRRQTDMEMERAAMAYAAM